MQKVTRKEEPCRPPYVCVSRDSSHQSRKRKKKEIRRVYMKKVEYNVFFHFNEYKYLNFSLNFRSEINFGHVDGYNKLKSYGFLSIAV